MAEFQWFPIHLDGGLEHKVKVCPGKVIFSIQKNSQCKKKSLFVDILLLFVLSPYPDELETTEIRPLGGLNSETLAISHSRQEQLQTF